jgi:hypothetical protein
MNFIFRFLKHKVGKFIDGNLIGVKNREENRKRKYPKKEHNFSDNHDDDNWTY